MSVDRYSGKFFLALVGGIALSACSPKASTAVPPVFAAAAPTAAPPASAAPVAPLVTGLPDFTALVDHYGPAVVNVKINQRPERSPQSRRGPQQRQAPPEPDNPLDWFRQFGLPGMGGQPQPQQQQPTRGEGSGFIVSADGYILTNAHVVKDATDITVKLTDRREFPAKVIGFDERTDVAVIKIEGKDLPVVRIGDPSKLKPGQWVVAIGSPFGMENSVTAGIVSATSRDLPDDNGGSSYVPFIQTDVAVNPGNSGGPLFNLSGEVVGINSQIYSQSGGYMGLSFAIPIDMANDVREQLVKNGRVTRSKIGVGIEEVDADRAEVFGLDRPRGALVSKVYENEPADKAGVKEGDIILAVDGKPIETSSALPAMISTLRPGSSVDLEVWTDHKLRKVTARVVELKEDDAAAPSRQSPGKGGGSNVKPEPAALGMTVRPLTQEEKQQVNTKGSLVVEDVDGVAEAVGIRPGDIILGLPGAPGVKTVAELQAAIKRSTGSKVALQIQRGDVQRYITVPKE
jgi:serine protease Do